MQSLQKTEQINTRFSPPCDTIATCCGAARCLRTPDPSSHDGYSAPAINLDLKKTIEAGSDAIAERS